MVRRDLSTPLAASKFDQNDPKKKKKKRMTRKQVKAEQAKPVPKKMTPKKPDASKVLDSQIKTEERRKVRQTGMLVRGGKESGDKRDFFGGTNKRARELAEKNLGRGPLKHEDSVKRMKEWKKRHAKKLRK